MGEQPNARVKAPVAKRRHITALKTGTHASGIGEPAAVLNGTNWQAVISRGIETKGPLKPERIVELRL